MDTSSSLSLSSLIKTNILTKTYLYHRKFIQKPGSTENPDPLLRLKTSIHKIFNKPNSIKARSSQEKDISHKVGVSMSKFLRSNTPRTSTILNKPFSRFSIERNDKSRVSEQSSEVSLALRLRSSESFAQRESRKDSGKVIMRKSNKLKTYRLEENEKVKLKFSSGVKASSRDYMGILEKFVILEVLHDCQNIKIQLIQERKSSFKYILKTHKTHSEGLNNYKNEVNCLSRIKHANIVKIYSFFEDIEGSNIILSYVPGKNSLKGFTKCLAKFRSLELEITRIMNQCVSAVYEIAAKKIIHGNICSEKFLLDSNLKVVLCGFSNCRIEEYSKIPSKLNANDSFEDLECFIRIMMDLVFLKKETLNVYFEELFNRDFHDKGKNKFFRNLISVLNNKFS